MATVTTLLREKRTPRRVISSGFYFCCSLDALVGSLRKKNENYRNRMVFNSEAIVLKSDPADWASGLKVCIYRSLRFCRLR